LRLKLPISLGPEVREELARVHDAGYVVVAARLQQQDADVGIFGQTARNDGPGHARFAHDEVVLPLELGSELPLNRANALREIRRQYSLVCRFHLSNPCFQNAATAGPANSPAKRCEMICRASSTNSRTISLAGLSSRTRPTLLPSGRSIESISPVASEFGGKPMKRSTGLG